MTRQFFSKKLPSGYRIIKNNKMKENQNITFEQNPIL